MTTQEYGLTLWVARDPDGELYLYGKEPHKEYSDWHEEWDWSEAPAGHESKYLLGICDNKEFSRVMGFLPRKGTCERIELKIVRHKP